MTVNDIGIMFYVRLVLAIKSGLQRNAKKNLTKTS